MKHSAGRKRIAIVMLGTAIMMASLACGSGGGATPTPTLMGGGDLPPSEPSNRCDGLSGSLEMQVLVGPSEVVGLEPFAVGTIPFSVASDGGLYVIQGSGSITYEDVLQQAWGTYTVSFDLQAQVEGACEGDESSGTLHAAISISGEQMVEVRAEGFQGDYPWSGSYELELSFPIEEGASAEGEGWTFILHLNS